MSPLLDLHDVADRLHIHWKTAYKLVHAKKIASLRIGFGRRATLRVEPEALDRYVASLREESPVKPVKRSAPAREHVYDETFR